MTKVVLDPDILIASNELFKALHKQQILYIKERRDALLYHFPALQAISKVTHNQLGLLPRTKSKIKRSLYN